MVKKRYEPVEYVPEVIKKMRGESAMETEKKKESGEKIDITKLKAEIKKEIWAEYKKANEDPKNWTEVFRTVVEGAQGEHVLVSVSQNTFTGIMKIVKV